MLVGFHHRQGYRIRDQGSGTEGLRDLETVWFALFLVHSQKPVKGAVCGKAGYVVQSKVKINIENRAGYFVVSVMLLTDRKNSR
jgi:hypothetical protein